MLTLEQCKKLKEWGLPQGKSYFEYWAVGGLGAGMPVRIDITKADEHSGTVLCSIPDLEQLLEFAKTKDILVVLKPTRDGYITIDYAKSFSSHDPDPKVAIYKLLERIIEPNNKVEETENGGN